MDMNRRSGPTAIGAFSIVRRRARAPVQFLDLHLHGLPLTS